MSSDALSDSVLNVVIQLLETDGYDAVTLRRVAAEGHFSFTTIYRRWATRDAVIVAALEVWTSHNRYAKLPDLDASTISIETARTEFMSAFRVLFEPWEQHPMMLRAFYRASMTPDGRRLSAQGMAQVWPRLRRVSAGLELPFRDDLDAVVSNVIHALMSRFANNDIGIEEFLPTIDKAVYWMLAGYEHSRERQPILSTDRRSSSRRRRTPPDLV